MPLITPTMKSQTRFNENVVELAALDWLSELGYSIVFGGDIAPGEPAAERASYGEVLLLGGCGRRWIASTPTSRPPLARVRSTKPSAASAAPKARTRWSTITPSTAC